MKVNIISSKRQEFGGLNYYLCGQYFQKNGVRLHRVVWQYFNGPIPKGSHVHHIDGNRSNNDITNLQLMKGSAHLSQHLKESQQGKRTIELVRHKAVEWHKSAAGLAWHREHFEKVGRKALSELVDKVCEHCGKKFKARIAQKTTGRFCSNGCKSKWRRFHGIDNEQRTCVMCSATFTIDKYQKKQTCSDYCARRYASLNRIANRI